MHKYRSKTTCTARGRAVKSRQRSSSAQSQRLRVSADIEQMSDGMVQYALSLRSM